MNETTLPNGRAGPNSLMLWNVGFWSLLVQILKIQNLSNSDWTKMDRAYSEKWTASMLIKRGDKRGSRMLLTCLSPVTGRKISCCDNISCLRYTRPTARSSFSSLLPANCFSSLWATSLATFCCLQYESFTVFAKSTLFSLTSPYGIIRIFSPSCFLFHASQKLLWRFPRINGIGSSPHQIEMIARKSKWISPVLRMEHGTVHGLWFCPYCVLTDL